MRRAYKDTEIDWMQIHDAGCTIDDTELPHHLTNKSDLERLLEGTFRSFLNALPADPTVVTIARYTVIPATRPLQPQPPHSDITWYPRFTTVVIRLALRYQVLTTNWASKARNNNIISGI
jgi:hypothetical protein